MKSEVKAAASTGPGTAGCQTAAGVRVGNSVDHAGITTAAPNMGAAVPAARRRNGYR